MSDPAFKCETCNFSTNIPIKWQQHTELASHLKKTGGKPRDKSVKYKCPYCKKEYAFMSKLCIHMNSACKKRPITKQDEPEPENSSESDTESDNEINIPQNNIVAQQSNVVTTASGEKVKVNINVINQEDSKKKCIAYMQIVSPKMEKEFHI